MGFTFEGVCSINEQQLQKNREYSNSLNPTPVKEFPIKSPLAIVGGGHSVGQYKYTLQSWPGTIWAVNGAWKWCKENGIDAVFFSFDASPSLANIASGASRAILSHHCDPSVYQAIDGQFWVGTTREGGSTSVGAAIACGIECGASSIMLFGCESSMQPDNSHIYGHYTGDDDMVVWCNNMHFYTTARMFIGCVEVQNIIKACPLVKERSGGLLRAMVETKDKPVVVGCSPALHDQFIQAA